MTEPLPRTVGRGERLDRAPVLALLAAWGHDPDRVVSVLLGPYGCNVTERAGKGVEHVTLHEWTTTV